MQDKNEVGVLDGVGSMARQWRVQVEAHEAQSIKAMGGEERGDFWRPYATLFRCNPTRTDDVLLNRLLPLISQGQSVLDVGGGAGRYALPLALHGHHVTIVEPSESMIEALHDGARDAGIDRIDVIQGKWGEVEVPSADVVLCAHVLYGVADIVPFIKSMEAHAARNVLILMFLDSPQRHTAQCWRAVHMERRINLPGLRDLLPLLWELEIYPALDMFPSTPPFHYESIEQARNELATRCYVSPGTEEELRLDRAVSELLVKSREGISIRDTAPKRQGLLFWDPRRE